MALEVSISTVATEGVVHNLEMSLEALNLATTAELAAEMGLASLNSTSAATAVEGAVHNLEMAPEALNSVTAAAEAEEDATPPSPLRVEHTFGPLTKKTRSKRPPYVPPKTEEEYLTDCIHSLGRSHCSGGSATSTTSNSIATATVSTAFNNKKEFDFLDPQNRSHGCTVCNKTFQSYPAFRGHKATHRNKPIKNYIPSASAAPANVSTLNPSSGDINRRFYKLGQFTVLSYNILSQLYINTAKYHYCPEWALTWEYRSRNLLLEILQHDADILCLQEVQSDHFDNFFAPQLFSYGYLGIYKRKMQQVMVDYKFVMDGCAIFFRHDRFDLVNTYEVEFDKPARRVVEKLGTDERKNALFRLLKGNIALAVILEEKGSRDAVKFRVCVANTHIHADPKAPEVKLFQVVKFIKGLEKIAASQIPIVACGDMNSLPGSDPYRFVVEGRVECSKGPDPLRVYEDLILSHSMQLASAYSRLHGRYRKKKMQHKDIEPSYTILTPNFHGTLDYIFYTKDKIEVDSLLKLPDHPSLGEMQLPSPLWSSDHVALMANFRLHPKFQKLQSSMLPHDPWEQEQG